MACTQSLLGVTLPLSHQWPTRLKSSTALPTRRPVTGNAGLQRPCLRLCFSGRVRARCAPATPSICRSAAAAKAPITCRASKEHGECLAPLCRLACNQTLHVLVRKHTLAQSHENRLTYAAGRQTRLCQRAAPRLKSNSVRPAVLASTCSFCTQAQIAYRPGGTWLMAVAEVTAE